MDPSSIAVFSEQHAHSSPAISFCSSFLFSF